MFAQIFSSVSGTVSVFLGVICVRLGLDAGLIQKVGQKDKIIVISGIFFLYISYEGLPGNRVLFVLLSKYQHFVWALRAFRGSFPGSFSCTSLTKYFLENRVKVPGVPGFCSCTSEHSAIILRHTFRLCDQKGAG